MKTYHSQSRIPFIVSLVMLSVYSLLGAYSNLTGVAPPAPALADVEDVAPIADTQLVIADIDANELKL